MLIVGLTGSIASGKSYTANRIRQFGVPVLDADASVHRLFRAGSPLAARIGEAFPGSLADDGSVDRKALGAVVFGDAAKLRRLEGLVHPAVRALQRRFLLDRCREGCAVVVLDVPLLFETGGERRCDLTAVVDVHPWLQRSRALARPGMTPERLEAVLAQQTPRVEKLKRADVVLPSGFDRGETARAVAGLIRRSEKAAPRAWPGRWLR